MTQMRDKSDPTTPTANVQDGGDSAPLESAIMGSIMGSVDSNDILPFDVLLFCLRIVSAVSGYMNNDKLASIVHRWL